MHKLVLGIWVHILPEAFYSMPGAGRTCLPGIWVWTLPRGLITGGYRSPLLPLGEGTPVTPGQVGC